MKPLRKHLKGIALLLSVVVLLQSCAVYLKSPSVERAVLKQKPVKIKTTNQNTYKFNRIFFVNEKLYGLVKSNSIVSRIFKEKIVSSANNPTYDQIEISELEISKIYVFNTLASIGITLLIGGFIVGASAVFGMLL